MHSKKVLHDAQLKITHSRQIVLDFFLSHKLPRPAEDVFSFLEEKKCDTDRATVYRILDTFVEKGILNRVEFQEGKFRYEIAGSDHHHLICESCGSIEDISDCGIDAWKGEILSKKGFSVKRHSLEFYGICQQCLK
jgi:Fur family transcriptional regulator, ferric uptake regulator